MDCLSCIILRSLIFLVRLFFLRLFVDLFPSFLPSALHSLIRPFLPSFSPSFSHSFVPSFLPSLIYSLIRPFLPSFHPSFIHSFHPFSPPSILHPSINFIQLLRSFYSSFSSPLSLLYSCVPRNVSLFFSYLILSLYGEVIILLHLTYGFYLRVQEL